MTIYALIPTPCFHLILNAEDSHLSSPSCRPPTLIIARPASRESSTTKRKKDWQSKKAEINNELTLAEPLATHPVSGRLGNDCDKDGFGGLLLLLHRSLVWRPKKHKKLQ